MSVHFVLPNRPLLLLFVILIMVGVGLAGFIYLPSAVITIQARLTERTVRQDIFLSSHAEGPDFTKFVLPARVVDRTIVEEKQVKRAGLEVTEDFSRGRVVLVNERDEEQPLLPKTHLKHEATGRYFLTDTPVTIPPHSRVAMTITAKEKGAAGEVNPGRFIIDKLPGNLQADVYGESTQQLSGGIIVESPLTEDEINAARDELMAVIGERLHGELVAAAGGAALRDDLMAFEVENEELSAEVSSRAQEFVVRRRVRGRAFVVAENDLLSLALLALRAQVDPNEEFISYEPDSFALDVARVDFERGEALVSAGLTGSYAAKVGPSILRVDNLAGLSPAEVREHFAHYPAVGAVDVSFSPFWVRSVPSRPSAVEIALKEAQ